MGVRIGELAKMTGCKVVTIRYYEKEGLLGSPERSGANYRLYEESDVERLRFIMHCRQHGLNLSEIREILSFRDHPNVDCRWLHTLIDRHIASVDAQIASLQHLKVHLLKILGHGHGGDCGPRCEVIENLEQGEQCENCKIVSCRWQEVEKEIEEISHHHGDPSAAS